MKFLKINPANPENKLLQEAAYIITSGGVIGYPTETVYGLGANAFNSSAVNKIYYLKGRGKNKPILIIASDLDQVKQLVSFFPETADILARSFWPGPLTMIFKAADFLNKQLSGKGNTIGIRVPDNKISLELLRLCGVPLTSTSANISGGKNPISAEEVAENFGNKLDLIIDGGISQSRTPSTVVSLADESITMIRDGAISKLEIEQVIRSKINEN